MFGKKKRRIERLEKKVLNLREEFEEQNNRQQNAIQKLQEDVLLYGTDNNDRYLCLCPCKVKDVIKAILEYFNLELETKPKKVVAKKQKRKGDTVEQDEY